MPESSSRQRFAAYREDVNRNGAPERGDTHRKGERAKRGRTFGELFRTFLRLLGNQRRPVFFALTTLTIATALKLAPPAAVKVTVDYVLTDRALPAEWVAWGVPTDRRELLLLITGAVVVTSIVASLVHLWGRWFATKAVNRMQVSLRKQVFEQAVHLPLHRVYDLKSGGASSLLRDDAGGAAELVFSMLYNPWRAIVQLVGSLVILSIVDWRMMVGGLLIVPFVYFTHRTWIHRIRPLWRDVRAQRQDIDSYTTEAFGGMRIVRGFARERTESGRFVRESDLLVRKQLFVWWWTRFVDLSWDALIPLVSTGLLLYGGLQILDGTMTLGDLTMFLFYLTMLLEPLATLVASAATFQNNLAGLDRVLDVLEEPREMEPAAGAVAVSPESVRGRLTFRDVSFRYPNADRDVLRNVSLDVEPGETMALVGRSGAGKTTLCNLVARFYDPTAGSVELDGVNLRNIHVDSYRRLLGIVEQDVFLFDGTIADNIRYGRRGATEREIREAARAANADGFIARLPEGYDTWIGERGVKLSGGQRQRLAIARAILADPRILILDEATSNLDSESEQLIQQSLTRLMRGRTCFVIAHRMSTIGLADRIAVLDEGELLAVGPHHELIATSDLYRRMVELQTLDTSKFGKVNSSIEHDRTLATDELIGRP